MLTVISENYLLLCELEYANEHYAIAKIAGIKMCESYNIQYGTNFVPVMTPYLYEPNDNYNHQRSHVLPVLIPKMYLGKYLENNDWESLRKDLKKYSIEGVNDPTSETEIIEKLAKYRIQYSTITRHLIIVILWGIGKPYREFLFVDDLIDFCVFVMDHVNFIDLEALSSESFALC